MPSVSYNERLQIASLTGGGPLCAYDLKPNSYEISKDVKCLNSPGCVQVVQVATF